jgi:hypothetical protein
MPTAKREKKPVRYMFDLSLARDDGKPLGKKELAWLDKIRKQLVDGGFGISIAMFEQSLARDDGKPLGKKELAWLDKIRKQLVDGGFGISIT